MPSQASVASFAVGTRVSAKKILGVLVNETTGAFPAYDIPGCVPN